MMPERAPETRAPTARPDRPRRPSWAATALRPDVVRRSLRVAAVVGTLLVAINHGDRALGGSLTSADWLKMALTYLVPYGVATWAAVAAIRGPGPG